jgi:hypothetical protein
MKTVLWVYIAFNLLQAVLLTFSPELTDRAYLGGEYLFWNAGSQLAYWGREPAS